MVLAGTAGLCGVRLSLTHMRRAVLSHKFWWFHQTSFQRNPTVDNLFPNLNFNSTGILSCYFKPSKRPQNAKWSHLVFPRRQLKKDPKTACLASNSIASHEANLLLNRFVSIFRWKNLVNGIRWNRWFVVCWRSKKTLKKLKSQTVTHLVWWWNLFLVAFFLFFFLLADCLHIS